MRHRKVIARRRARLSTTGDPTAESVGERIARLRRARGWKQKELATRIGSSLQQISKYERGRYTPRSEVVARLAEAFGVSADYLLTGRSPYQPQGDFRLRERLESLERLPAPMRDALVIFLDGLLNAYRLTSRSRSGSGGPFA
jgi:transcriptional regulator with XRE-family HTH domain